MGSEVFKSLKKHDSLLVKVRVSIEEAILTGKIKPGERLIEDELSKVFKISRGPIREAFRLLEKDGFIKFIPRKGAVVEEITFEDVEDMYEVRSVLEGLAAKLFCERANSKDQHKLQQIYEQSEIHYKNDNLSKYNESNEEFHNLIIEGSNNKKIQSISEFLQKQINWFQKSYLSHEIRFKASLKHHRRILDAILKGDAQKAEDEAKFHLEQALEIYREVIKSSGKVSSE